MKTRIAIGILLVTNCLLACSHELTPGASLQVCNDAVQHYDTAVRSGHMQTIAEARSRVLQQCYSGTGRAPTLREPLSIGTATKADTPVKVTPSVPTIVIPTAPSVLTTCDAGGCWDQLGNRYNGTGTTLMGPTGKLCIRIGDRIDCP